jgi:hypothetical protein
MPASAEVVDRLGELLGVLPEGRRPRDEVQGSVNRALANGGDRALATYDHLREEPLEGRQYLWYSRDELAHRLATERVLARLPSSISDVAAVFEARDEVA